MASLLLLLCLFVGSSLSSATPLLGCSFGDRQMSPSERIKDFVDCLRNQGHDEEILNELRRSYDDHAATPSAGPVPPNCAPEMASDERGRFPYCSGMSDLQCRTLILVLDSLVNAPSRTSYSGGISLEKIFRDPIQVVAQDTSSSSSSSSTDDEEAQAALMNIILARFNDILEEYKRWRMENGGRKKRSAKDSSAPVQPPIDEKNANKNATSGQKIDTSEEGTKFAPEATSSRRVRSVKARRQVDPGLPFKMPAKLTPEMQAVLEGYLAWREKNGYGKMSGRWG